MRRTIGYAPVPQGDFARPGGRMAEEFLTPEQAAAIAQVSVFTIRRWIKEGELPARKVGRLWRIRRSDVERRLAPEPSPRRPTRPK